MARNGSKYPQLNDKEWLYQKYWKEKLSSYKIAEIVGCEATAVLDALRRSGIQIRKRREWIKERLDERLFDKKWLYCKYWIEGLSTREIGLFIGCDRKTIQTCLKRYHIPRRSYSEALGGEMHPLHNKQHTAETKQKISEAHKGKLGLAGEKNPMYGKHPSKETRRKMGDAHRGLHYIPKDARERLSKMRMGENNPNWRGGDSIKYCEKWNEEFREYIRAKFGRVCFLCGKTEEENGRKLSVHHVSYDKGCGCAETEEERKADDASCQFVPLCHGCHTKTNRNRDYWERTILKKLHEKLNGWFI